jgi:hypothetical protein
MGSGMVAEVAALAAAAGGSVGDEAIFLRPATAAASTADCNDDDVSAANCATDVTEMRADAQDMNFWTDCDVCGIVVAAEAVVVVVVAIEEVS